MPCMEKSSLSARIFEFDNRTLSTVINNANKDQARCEKKKYINSDFIYFVGEILDDAFSFYLGVIIGYFGKNCELENNDLKKCIGEIMHMVKKEKLEIQHIIVSLTFNILCGSDGKNSECDKKEYILTILIFSWTDYGDKAFDLAFIVLL